MAKLPLTAFVAALLACVAAVPAAAVEPSAARLEAARTEVAETVAGAIPGATLRRTDGGEIDPLFNVPAAQDLALGRTEVMMDPNFWVAAVQNLLKGGTITPPVPIDWVKPEAFLPTAPVADGEYVSALPRQDVDLSEVTYEWLGERKTIRQFLRTTETDVVAFAHNGRVVADFYENGWSADVQHQPWSVTKSFISTVVGVAVDEGRIRSLDDPVDAYLPELKGTAWEGAAIRDVLQMESGVFWDEDTPVLAQNTQVQQWVQAALDLVTDGQLGQDRNEFLKALPKEVAPGTKWRYNSGATQVLAWVTEAVYGKPFNEIISEKLWKPAGMDGDARILTDRLGNAIASQGLYSRVFDLTRFGELIRNGGVTPEGRRVVSKAWVREATATQPIPKGRYGYQWWGGPLPGSYQASGFQGQKISIAEDHCLVGVRLSHSFGFDTRPGDGPAEDPESYGFGTEFHALEWNEMYRAVAARLGPCERAAFKPRVALGGLRQLSRRAALRRGALRVRVRGSGKVRISAMTTGRNRVRVAARTVTLRPGTARWVDLPLTRAGRRLLRADRRLRLRLVAPGASRILVLR